MAMIDTAIPHATRGRGNRSYPELVKYPRKPYPNHSIGMEIEAPSGARLFLYDKYEFAVWKPTAAQCRAVRMFMKRELGKQRSK